MLMEADEIIGMMPIISRGKRAKNEQVTVMTRRLLKRRTSQIDMSWKRLVNVGNAASNPIWKLFAPIKSAIATRKAPPVRVVIASAASPSPITILKPFRVSSSVRSLLGRKFTL